MRAVLNSNLFVVRSPLQAINAYEFAKKFNTKNNIIIIVFNDNKKNSDQTLSAIKLFDFWDDIVTVKNAKTKFFSYLKLFYEFNNIYYDNIIIGGFSNFERIILANFNYNNSYIVDDGTATIVDHKKILNYYNLANKQPIKLKDFRFKVFGIKTRVEKQIQFFTIFNLPKKLKIVKNNFGYLGKFFKVSKKDKNIYIAGQSFVVFNIIDKRLYI